MKTTWNPWHGCRKISEGCKHCYVYRIDAMHGRDASLVKKTSLFNLPVRRDRSRSYKIPSGQTVFTCFTSDFLLEEADEWRKEAWEMMKIRSDLNFFFITKRIHRLESVVPPDWGEGYSNVTIACTAENQEMADYRIPIYKNAPIKNERIIICEPLLGPINLSKHLGTWVSQIIAGGESGLETRICDYNWVLDIRKQCAKVGISFIFKQTGARFLKDGKLYKIDKKLQHKQAKKANINL
ncbi:Bacteriophage protein gp37 [Elusimicrobium minutum Pei191]|uniref:Bacteriophage protein gp37 n=1 Tax=Elusimicrobium minutum (strain Pei191) TaxID=445932 RepID=B2KBK6_ELUMP|nr:DUF5131 family protein [Elusimicrobium minutum]ACC98028.1 Bacteriophage protein gp37 [Elusimicrobium minutum Pei191]